MSFNQFNDRFPPRNSLSPDAEVVNLSLGANPYLALQDALSGLLAFALAHITNGRFILNLDNTDPDLLQTRIPNQALELLLWLQAPPDEFHELGEYGPYAWRERRHIYHEVAMYLVEQGYAYHCFCHSKLETANRIFQQHMPHDTCRSLPFDRLCDRLINGEKYLIRFQVPGGTSNREDSLPGQTLEDFVLLTPQGLPMPYFAHVVDNHFMHVTTQVRRADSRSISAEETLLYQAMGWDMPKQIYVPYIDDTETSYLFEETCLNQFRQKGYLPESLVNTLTSLIWSHPNHEAIYPFADFASHFDYNTSLPDEITFNYELLDRIQKWYAMNKI